jgi:hypothetical protein
MVCWLNQGDAIFTVLQTRGVRITRLYVADR